MKSPLIRITAVVLGTALVPHLTGCTLKRGTFLDMADVEQPASEDISGVFTSEGDTIRFDKGSAELSNDTIYASVGQEPYSIAVDQVKQLRVSRSWSSTLPLSVKIALTAVGIGLSALFLYYALIKPIQEAQEAVP